MPYHVDIVKAKIAFLAKNPPQSIRGTVSGHHIILDIVDAEQHFWSPQMNFRIESDEDDPTKTIVAGIIGPKPTVWTLFVFIYFTVGMSGFVLFSYAVSLRMMGEQSNYIWALPVAIVFMATAYKAGKVGEKLGEEQTEKLKAFIRNAIKVEQYSKVENEL